MNFHENPDKDLVIIINRYGDELHLTRAILQEINLVVDDALDMLREGSPHEQALVEMLEPVAAWLEQAEAFGRTALTDLDNMQMEVVPE